MTVEGWIEYLSRQPRTLEVVLADGDPNSDEFLRASPYEPETVFVRGLGVNRRKCLVVGMELAAHRGPIVRQAGAKSDWTRHSWKPRPSTMMAQEE